MASGADIMAETGDHAGKTEKKERAPKVPKVVTTKHETVRVGKLLRRDRVEAAAELARVTAIGEVSAGRIKNLEDTFVRPTPEHARQVKFEHVTVEKDGAGREVKALRRVSANRVKQLYDRKIFTDETYPAVLWYQRQFEAAGFDLGASAANWGEAIVGERSYGAMPKSATAAEARHLFRFARGGRRQDGDDGEISFESWSLPGDMLPTFDLVVLDEMTIQDAATETNCRYTNAALAVKHVALLLSERVSHLLPVRAVGAPGSDPTDTKDIERLRKAEALRDGSTVAGEKQAAADAAERLRGRIGPIFFDDHGLLRKWDAIAAIVRMRVAGIADAEILAIIGGGE